MAYENIILDRSVPWAGRWEWQNLRPRLLDRVRHHGTLMGLEVIENDHISLVQFRRQ